MKKISLLLTTLVLSATLAMAQCPQITSAQFIRTGITSYSLTVNYTGGNGNINVLIFCATNPTSGIPDVRCFAANGTGTNTINFNCFIEPLVILVPTVDAPCGQGAPCSTPYFVSNPGSGPVPIKLGSFYANRDGNQIKLIWESQTEINAERYQIERKIDRDFEVVAEIEATNNIAGSQYSYVDVNPTAATSQYRLKMVDQDGTYSYSEIRAVKGMGTGTDFSIFPNPSSGTSRLTITDITPSTEVQVVDHAGRIVRTIRMHNTNSIELNNLQKGMYMIRVINKETGAVVTRKLSVIH
ncbi:MAG TPA: T9SS type A sorting domain-containing protein [Ferruginibacter sp.]|nr:T9SS type A sorting domain-containing protein [Ferruginibacter sp.]HRO96470.1 T9SS type A sorting domain-containing protein [Ferruginibacter sp.]